MGAMKRYIDEEISEDEFRKILNQRISKEHEDKVEKNRLKRNVGMIFFCAVGLS